MSATWKTVRVFISSTFRDMHAERDHLVIVVFPEFRERVEQLGLEFFDVDLRWGVPTKDNKGETANSWEYCRQWIDRVEPFFVCILGQRYGWVPEPEQLKSREDRQRQQDEQRSITDMEVRHAVLSTERKRRSYFYLRATEAPATASEYVDPPALLDKLEQLKQEVRACGRPVRDYPCQWTGSGFTGLEEFGRRVLDDLWSGVLRDERYVSKEVWRQVLKADPDRDPCYTDESQPVPADLAKELVQLAKPKPKDPLDAEREQMEAFAQARLRWFQGRTKELKQLTDFINSTDEQTPHLAAVVAVPGQGKSALLAKLHELLKSSSQFVITHFVGATEHSASAHALIQRLLDELDRSGINWPDEHPKEGDEPKRDFNSLCLRLAQRLGDYAGERRIVILLDALNQLSDGHDLHWLPTRLGPGVRVIVSSIEDASTKPNCPEQRVFQAFAYRKTELLRIPLGPLTEADVRTIVVAYLKEYCHELDREHLDTLCAITQARNPLYLQVMLNELRTLGGNDLNKLVPELIASMPRNHPDIVSLFQWVLRRMEDGFGTEAVRWWCLYLAHGRVGMASHELADLLARKLGADAAATALRIERGLRRYLLRRSETLDFFHGQLKQAVMDHFGVKVETIAVHSDIAGYFRDQSDPAKDQSWNGGSPRALGELPNHLIHARLWPALEAVLGDMFYCEARLRISNPLELSHDCRQALQVHASTVVSALDQSLMSGLNALLERPDLSLQTLLNRLTGLAGNEPTVRLCIVRAQRFLDGQGAWLEACSAYLGTAADSLRLPFQMQTIAQCLSADSKRITLLGDNGCIKVFDLIQERLLFERVLPPVKNRKTTTIQTVESGDQIAWIDSMGWLCLESSEAKLQIRPGESKISFLSGCGLIVVNPKSELIAWNTETQSVMILAENVPGPVKVLRQIHSRALVCVAGDNPQRVVVYTTNPQSGPKLELDIIWNDAPIMDADFDVNGGIMVFLCRDRSVRRISVQDGASLSTPCRYEQGRPAAIIGAPLRCALGLGGSAGWCFVATLSGQSGAWNMQSGEFRRLPDLISDNSFALNLFTCLEESGKLLVGLRGEARLLTQNSARSSESTDRTPVSACAVSDQGDVISVSGYDGTVTWTLGDLSPGKVVRQNHSGVVAVSSISGSSDVWLGNDKGWCWRQPPNRVVTREEIWCLFERRITALASQGQAVFAADFTGSTMLLEDTTTEPVILRHGPGDSFGQFALQPAAAKHKCLSLYRKNERGNLTTCVTLIEGAGRETEVLRDISWATCFAYAPVQSLLGLGGSRVQLTKIWKDRVADLLYQRQANAVYLNFVSGGTHLAVVRGDIPWLEVWKISAGLPTVAAADLPGRVTCFAANGSIIALGFASGETLRFRLRMQPQSTHPQ
jgi:WD40 repeat protein